MRPIYFPLYSQSPFFLSVKVSSRTSSEPYNSSCWTVSGSSLNGFPISQPFFSASFSALCTIYFMLFQGMKPPSPSGSSGLTASSGEKCEWKPRPPQSGQAPKGALKEKRRGSISGRLIWHSGQIYFSVSSISAVPSEASMMKPSESLSAISIASLRRERFSSLTRIRSIRHSMVWRLFLSSSTASSSQ